MRILKIIPAVMFLALVSCREEIIPPGNPAGNINQPVKETFFNSYSFLINAGDITYNIQDYLKFDNSRVQVYISLLDYTSGSVEVSLVSKSRQVIFNKVAGTEIKGEYSQVNNIPESVIINFRNFTGKFRLSVNPY